MWVLLSYCFLPTIMTTTLESPLSTWTGLFALCCGGVMPTDRAMFKANPALMLDGRSAGGVACRDSGDVCDSTVTLVPSSRLAGTAKSTSFPYTLIAGDGEPIGGFTLFHPASLRFLSISIRACSHYLRASTMSAKLRKPMKRTSSFSKREKILRKPLSLRNSRSISLRFL